MKQSWFVALLFAAAIVLICGAHAPFLPTVLSLILLLLLCATAFPLSRFLFDTGVEAWIFTIPIGYLLHSFLLSVFSKLFGFGYLVFAIYFCIIISIAFFLLRNSSKLPQAAKDWQPFDRWMMLIWLLTALFMITLPFLHVGAITSKGTAFRAYFNTDVFRNMATAGSLVYTGIPPENPYFSGFPLHYYWFFHILPAYWIRFFPTLPVQSIFVQFPMVISLTFVAVLFLTVRRFVKSKATLLLTLPLFAFGGSYEGLFVLNYLSERNLSWKKFTNLNIDGILRWIYDMPQIDALFRPLLYAPQHLLIVTVALISIYFWSFTTNRKKSATLLMLLLIFISVGFSVIVGALLILAAGIILLNSVREDPGHNWPVLVAGGIIGLAFGYLYLDVYQMFSLQAKSVSFGFNRNILLHPFGYFVLNWGALLILGVAGILFFKPRNWILYLFLLLSLIFVLLVQVDAPGLSDVSLKAGYITDVTLLIFAAQFVDLLIAQKRKKLAFALALLFALPGSVTTILDIYNCQDIHNSRFTTYISPNKMQVYQWIRRNMDPGVRLQEYEPANQSFLTSFVSELPPFAMRSVFLGDTVLARIFQTPKQELEKRRTILWYFLQSESPAMIAELARTAGIQYVVDSFGRDSPFHLRESSSYFKLAYAEGNVGVYKLNSVPAAGDSTKAILMEQDGEIVLSASFEKNFYPPEVGEANLQARWISNDAELVLESASDLQGTFIFFAQAMGKNRTMQIALDGAPVHQQSISLSLMKVRFPLNLAAGKHLMRIHSVQGAESANKYFGGTDKRALSFRTWGLQFRRSQ